MRYLVLSILIALAGGVLSQTYSFKQYTVNNGLPTNETYCSIQDATGHLLIGTDNGVVIYDGTDFQQAEFADTRYSNTVIFNLQKDNKGRIWAKSYQHGLFILKKEKFEAYIFNDTILNIIGASFIDQFYIDKQDKLWFTISGLKNTIYTIDSKGNLRNNSSEDLPQHGVKLIYTFEKGYSVVVNLNYTQKNTSTNLFQCKWELTNIGKKKKLLNSNFSAKRPEPGNKSGYYLETSQYSYISTNNVLLKYDSQNKLIGKTEFEGQILNLSQDNSGNLLVSTRKGAYICMASSSYYNCILSTELVNHIYQDDEGSYWFSTINNGVFCLPKLDIYSIPKDKLPKEEIAFISGNKNYFAVSDKNKNIYLYQKSGNDFLLKSQIKSRDRHYHPRAMEFCGDSLYLGYSYIIPTQNIELPCNISDNQIIRYFNFEKKDTSLALISKNGFRVINYLTRKEKHNFSNTYELFTSFLSYQENLYLGSQHGLFTYDKRNGLHKIFVKDITQRVRDIKVIHDRYIVVSTKGQGVFIIDEQQIRHLNTKEGLSNSTCGEIVVQNDSIFWVGSNSGLNRILLNRNGKITINRILSSDGLLSDYIQDLSTVDNTLVILTGNGINYLDMERYQIREKKIKWSVLEINGSLIDTSGTFQVGTANRNLNLSAKTVNLSKVPSINYLFILRGENVEFSQSGVTPVSSFKNLPPGNYTLSVDIMASGQSLLNKPLVYSIEITPFFFERAWFKQGLIVSTILIVLGGIIYFLHKREQIRKRKYANYLLQLEALGLQLSPHFLFNSLNSILYLSVKKDHDSLNRFVSKLSSLLRKTLDNSLTTLISLHSELENTTRYIEMERFRFGTDTFSFEIETDTILDIDKEQVPPLILQPIVENAIWHGLLQKDGDRKLSIKIKAIIDGFLITIHDNGIGYTPSKSTKKTKAKKNSFGLKNVERRLKLYEKMDFGKTSFAIHSATKNSETISTGTTVQISFLPKKK